tara:strand:- start:948 stop:1163 length:216 start_codon:yes stop_codon:yes gene_type:complete
MSYNEKLSKERIYHINRIEGIKELHFFSEEFKKAMNNEIEKLLIESNYSMKFKTLKEAQDFEKGFEALADE